MPGRCAAPAPARDRDRGRVNYRTAATERAATASLRGIGEPGLAEQKRGGAWLTVFPDTARAGRGTAELIARTSPDSWGAS
ncbi:hypothetical protein ACFY2M_39875 [Streptomyces sp. NPDC001276]|uniref:hypothetical protein n=1 Tax=Streptomyces sp. NPDC001276 TaxID=3364555 RepID=UPI0036B646BA